MRKLKVFPEPAPATTKEEWAKLVKDTVRRYQKIFRSNPEKEDGALVFDLTEPFARRRQRAIVNTMPEIYSRYEAPKGGQRILAEVWRDLNLPFEAYTHSEREGHILLAASVWILDQIVASADWTRIYDLLPTDYEQLDWANTIDIWHTDYESELLYSVESVLRNRRPIEIDGIGCERTLTSEALAKGKKECSESFRELMSLIPQEAIEEAVAQFKELFWQWSDRFFDSAMPYMQKEADDYNQIRKDQLKFNRMADELDALMKKIKAKPSPLLAKPKLEELMKKPPSLLGVSKDADDGIALSIRMDRLEEKIDNTIDAADKQKNDFRLYQLRVIKAGYIKNGEVPMRPLRIENPYAVCFALLYLIEMDDDLPWLYGVGCGLMAEVIETLPWGIAAYYEEEDYRWEEDTPIAFNRELPKSIVIPDLYERRYEAEFPRNLAQIIYEETGCVLPTDMGRYNDRARMLRSYGIRGKDAALTLLLMNTLASARHTKTAVNLELDREEPSGTEELPDVDSLKEEIKHLKEALHSSEKESRETKKALANVKATAEREHRELADLREYIFNSKQTEEETPDESFEWPYEVEKNTIVFGGHDTWSKGIKGLLTGNIRFINKDFVFDTGIIKRAETIWIQPNALAHKMYYRIVDTARNYNKPVRYFAYASWAKCAEQVVEGDQ